MGITRNTTFTGSDMGYINLAAAILRQAYVDYINSLIGYKPHKTDKYGNEPPREIERFFESDWANLLSFGNADMICGRAYQTALKMTQKPRGKGKHLKTAYGLEERKWV